MKESNSDRRKFIKNSTALSGMLLFGSLSDKTKSTTIIKTVPMKVYPNRIKFAVININHSNINSMTEAVKRGGGEFVALYAK